MIGWDPHGCSRHRVGSQAVYFEKITSSFKFARHATIRQGNLSLLVHSQLAGYWPVLATFRQG